MNQIQDEIIEEAITLIKSGNNEKGIKLINEQAEKGNAEALYILGYLFYKGDDIPRNYKKAIQHLSLAMDKGNVHACFLLGSMYISGKGCDKSPDKAADIWSYGASNGDLSCAFNLAMLYERGIGIKQDIHKAISILRFCAQKGFEPAIKKLDTMSISKNNDIDIEALKKDAATGDPKAQYKLGTEYLRGRNLEKNKSEATRLFILAANNGNYLSKVALFNRYYIDAEYNTCWSLANYWLKQCIEQDAMRFKIIHPNLVEAISEITDAEKENNKNNKTMHIAKAADLGYYGAFVMLGDLCEANEKEAYGYYLKGAEFGDASAFLRLHDIYSNENSAFHSIDKAQEMLCKHAEIASILITFTN